MLSLYGGRGGNYIEQSMRGKLGEEEGVDGSRFLGVGGAKSNKSNANNESECVGKGSMCRDTFSSFSAVSFYFMWGDRRVVFSLIVRKPTPCRKGAVATQFQVFPRKKRAEATLRFPSSSTWISYSGQSENIQPRKGGRGEKKTGS